MTKELPRARFEPPPPRTSLAAGIARATRPVDRPAPPNDYRVPTHDVYTAEQRRKGRRLLAWLGFSVLGLVVLAYWLGRAA